MTSDRRRLLLVYPPFYRLFKDSYSLASFPLGLGYLAGAVLDHGGWDVMVYNADFNPRNETLKHGYIAETGFDHYRATIADPASPIWGEVRSALTEFRPDVVGICVKSPLFASARMIARLAREFDPRTTVIVGGAHPSTVGGEVLECADIDVAVVGEGERTIVELLDALTTGADLSGIAGVVFRRDGGIVTTPTRKHLDDLDQLRFPHLVAPLVLRDFASYPRSAFQYVFATRGCPYGCFFCGSRNVWTRQVRFRSPESMVAEIKSLRHEMGLQRVFFSDDTFGINAGYIRELCDALMRECPGLKWGCETHVKVVTEDSIARMKAAGCTLIKVGVESGNNDILHRINKGITIEEAYAACEIINRHRLALQVFFQVGYPWETEATLRDTVAAMRRIRSDYIILSIFTPYPGTAAFSYCREQGLVDDDFDIALYNHQSPANHFCMNIPPERFRVLVSRIERMVDRANHYRRIRRLFSISNVRRKVAEGSVGGALRKGMRAIAGR